MSKIVQSCLIGMIAVFITVQSCLGESEIDSHSRKLNPAETVSPLPAQDASLTETEKEALKSTVIEMIRTLNTFDFDEFASFFSEDSLEMLKHQVPRYHSSHLFELIFPEGKRKAKGLTSQAFFVRIISKSKFNVGISRPYEVNMTPKFRMDADDDGGIVTVFATFPESYSGYESRSEIFTFRRTDDKWIAEAPDFILSDFKYDLSRNFASQRTFYPLYPVTDTFRVMMGSFQQPNQGL